MQNSIWFSQAIFGKRNWAKNISTYSRKRELWAKQVTMDLTQS